MAHTKDTINRINRHIHNLGSTDDAVAFQAECRLIRFGSKAVDFLIDASASINPQVRFRAVWALGKIGDPRAYQEILRLTNDPDERVSYDAIMALGCLGDLRAIGPLIVLLSGTAEDELSAGACLASAAATALSKIGKAATDPLVEVLHCGGAHSRRMAACALGQIGGDSAIEALAALLTNSEEETRTAAREALELIGTPRSLALTA